MVDTPIVSERFQKDFRDNFPSQVSSGRDLHVSDVVVPIVDFSSTVGTTGLATNLQEAIDFNVTTFNFLNTTETIVNTTGFWRVRAVLTTPGSTNPSNVCKLFLDDGSTTKDIFYPRSYSIGNGNTNFFDQIIIIKTGVSLKGITDSVNYAITGTARQVASLDGTLNNPDGYTGQ